MDGTNSVIGTVCADCNHRMTTGGGDYSGSRLLATQVFCPLQAVHTQISNRLNSACVSRRGLVRDRRPGHTVLCSGVLLCDKFLSRIAVFWDVFVFRTLSNFQRLTKVVACAAFLACSLFGKSLHDLHHVIQELRSQQHVIVTSCCHSHRSTVTGERVHHHSSDQHGSDGHQHSE